MKNVVVLLLVLVLADSCRSYSDPDEMRIHAETVSADMNVTSIPQALIFKQRDSIPIVLNCSYKDSTFCCGGTEIYFMIDETLDFDRIYTDSTYDTGYCGCGDTIYLNKLNVGEHYINGNLQWNAGDWTYGKNFEMKINVK